MNSTTAQPDRLSVLICSAVNPNLIDGAVVQLVSLAETLAIAGFDVHVLLRAPIRDQEAQLTRRLLTVDGVTVVEPKHDELSKRSMMATPHRLAKIAEKYVQQKNVDFVIARDVEININLVRHTTIHEKLCSYLTNIPENARDLRLNRRLCQQISEIASAVRVFFIQTEESRSFLEAHFPQIAGKTILTPPMIPDEAFRDLTNANVDSERPLRLVYAGKFKREWKTLEMTQLASRAAERDIDIEVVFLGDKVMLAPGDETWPDRMREALERQEGLTWLGAVDREESLRHIQEADCGLSWRDISVDMSSQLSTKVLEYAAVGTPPLLRRNSAHEALLGTDYPLFIEGDDVIEVIAKVARDREILRAAQVQAQEAVRPYSFSNRSRELKHSLERVFLPQQVFSRTHRKNKILVAGYDFKFMGELTEFLGRDSTVELSFDKWDGTMSAKGTAPRKVREEADVIFCEWCTSSAVWYSQNKLPHQKLIIRLHRFEITRPWPFQVDWGNVDALVVIAPHMADRVIEETSVDPDKVHLIPNSIDLVDLERPKVRDAKFQLGMLGMVPIRKRPDRALAVLRELRRHDSRFTLHFRGRLPSTYFDFSRNSYFRAYYQDLFRQFTQPGDLYGAVFHDRFGPDVANWFRRVGWILSPSTDEGSHQAVAEGMASGTVPVLWDWEGADRVYPPKYVHQDEPAAIAGHILESVRSGKWEQQTEDAAKFVSRYDIDAVHGKWTHLFHLVRP